MEFDRSRVYTALNADELHKGDVVFVADNIVKLKEAVERHTPIRLEAVKDENFGYRFTTRGGKRYALAYLVCPARNADAYDTWHNGGKIELFNNGEWQEYAGTGEPAWTDFSFRPAGSLYRPFKDVDELLNTWYRLTSQENWPYLHGMSMPTIWVHHKNDGDDMLITGYDKGCNIVMIDSDWKSLANLFEHFTFLDGLPAGRSWHDVEE